MKKRRKKIKKIKKIMIKKKKKMRCQLKMSPSLLKMGITYCFFSQSYADQKPNTHSQTLNVKPLQKQQKELSAQNEL